VEQRRAEPFDLTPVVNLDLCAPLDAPGSGDGNGFEVKIAGMKDGKHIEDLFYHIRTGRFPYMKGRCSPESCKYREDGMKRCPVHSGDRACDPEASGPYWNFDHCSHNNQHAAFPPMNLKTYITILYSQQYPNSGASSLAGRRSCPQLKILSENERKILSAIINYIDATDRRLGEITGLGAKTVTYLRTRLHKRGYFRYVRIPAFGRLGAEVFCAAVFGLDSASERQTTVSALRNSLESATGVVWAVTEGNTAVVLGVYRSHAEMRAEMARLAAIRGVSGMETVTLPMPAMECGRFMDFREPPAGLGIDGEAGAQVPTSNRFRLLLGFEKKVFQALIGYPEEGPTALARRLGISRSAFITRTEEVERGRLYRTVVVPDIKHIGLETLAVWSFGGKQGKAEDIEAGEVAFGHFQEDPSLSNAGENVEWDEAKVTDEPVPCRPEGTMGSESVLPEGMLAGFTDSRDKEARGGGLEQRSPGASTVARAEKEPATIVQVSTAKVIEPKEEGILGIKECDGPVAKPSVESSGTRLNLDDEKMPWDISPLAKPARAALEASPQLDSKGTWGSKGIEALPKDLRTLLIGRPTKEAVDHVKAELERRHIRDIDMNQILQDAGFLPARRPAAVTQAQGHVHVPGTSGLKSGQTHYINVVPAQCTMEKPSADRQALPNGPLTEPMSTRTNSASQSSQRWRMTDNSAFPSPESVSSPRRRGRPPKNKIKATPEIGTSLRQTTITEASFGNAEGNPPEVPRRRGRPRKNPPVTGPAPEGYIDTSLGRLPRDIIGLLAGLRSMADLERVKAVMASRGIKIDLERVSANGKMRDGAGADPASHAIRSIDSERSAAKVKENKRCRTMAMEEFILRPERTKHDDKTDSKCPSERNKPGLGNQVENKNVVETSNLSLDKTGESPS